MYRSGVEYTGLDIVMSVRLVATISSKKVLKCQMNGRLQMICELSSAARDGEIAHTDNETSQDDDVVGFLAAKGYHFGESSLRDSVVCDSISGKDQVQAAEQLRRAFTQLANNSES